MSSAQLATQNTAHEVMETNDVLIGKDILELVTGAMYTDPLCVYREFVQNSADSLDEAAAITNEFDSRIDIQLDLQGRNIRIRDNGVGVSNADFIQKMTSIGGSEKRKREARGFRGVGRLAGLGYCRELVFRSKSKGDPEILEIIWSGRRFREILRDSDYGGSLSDVVQDVTSISSHSSSKEEPAFFEVELRGVVRIKSDILLNADSVGNYLAQVAPVPFHPSFRLGEKIQSALQDFQIGQTFPIFISEDTLDLERGEQIYRPIQSSFDLSPFKHDKIRGVKIVKLPGIERDVDAVGWIAEHSYLGAIPNDQLVKGLRFRCGNIQIGGNNLAAELFPESRFNSWVIGEFHVLNRKIVPNGRRDTFEENGHFANLQNNLQPVLKNIARTCRENSARRQWERRFDSSEADLREDLKLVESGSLSKRQSSRLGRSMDERVIELEQSVERNAYGFMRELAPRVESLRKDLDSIRDREITDDDPLSVVPYTKRLAFQEVLELIYANSQNKPVANSIVSKIVKQLAAKYGAK